MVLSSETCVDFGCMANFLSRYQGRAELRDISRDPVTCPPGKQTESRRSVNRRTPPEIDIKVLQNYREKSTMTKSTKDRRKAEREMTKHTKEKMTMAQ